MPEERVADPGPLGLAGFAMTTFCLSSWNAGIWHGAGLEAALALAFFYGGLAQLLAGMWEFVRKNTFAALAFTSYGAFWLSFYALIKFDIPGGGSDTVPIFLLGWAIFTVYMMIAATKTNNAVLTVFVLLSITFIFSRSATGERRTPSPTSSRRAAGPDSRRRRRRGTPRRRASRMLRTDKLCSRWVREANVGVTGGMPPDPTANSARAERYGRCWHLCALEHYSQLQSARRRFQQVRVQHRRGIHDRSKT